jgi:methylase of polypeptide subunit release factors
MKKIFQIKDFDLIYTDIPKMDGGGTSIGLDFVNILDTYYPDQKFNRCLEWCSGPGFIGFNLLLNNYCHELCLVDNFKPALDCALHSISGLDLPVTTYCIDQIANLPASEVFDLIVSNPPHFSFEVYQQEVVKKNIKRIYYDLDWEIHYEFFRNIKKNLSTDGIILLQESTWGCNHNTFNDILNEVDLTVSNYYNACNLVVDNYPIFYLEIKHK